MTQEGPTETSYESSYMFLKRIIRILVLLVVALLLVAYLLARPALLPIKVEPPTVTVDSATLRQHVYFLSEELQSRDYQSVGLSEAAEYIFQQFDSMNLNPIRQEFTVDGKKYQNVLVKLGPEAADLIVVGAHYDSFDRLPGADDNASGVAGLIELARVLSQLKLNQSVELVAYTLEEPPFFAGPSMGSMMHAKSIIKPVELMISLEMIGYFDEREHSQKYPIPLLDYLYPDEGNFIAVVDQFFSTAGPKLKNSLNQYSSLPAYSINTPQSLHGMDFSDHRNYWALGYPAVMVTDTAFYRNYNYHTSEDTYEKLNYEKMATLIEGLGMHILNLNK